jgi:murein DD-endopeptidase MepM/ murein hydrolase activator NlpD
MLAALSVSFAAQYPNSSRATSSVTVPSFALSGLTGSVQPRGYAYFRPGASNLTQSSVAILTARSDSSSVRAAGGVSPTSAFSSGVASAAAVSGEQGAGLKPLADIVDPRIPFVSYETQAGDSVSLVAQKYGISLGTLLDNNATVGNKDLIQKGQILVVPRKDGILYKVGYGDTLDSIVKQFDNISTSTVLDYKPNAIENPKQLEQGKYLLLPGATKKPPPPPPPTRPASGGGSISGSGAPRATAGGRFSAFPLAGWLGVSDEFGTSRGGGRIHEGIDLDLHGRHHSSVFSVCNGTVIKTEYLTYSYGYHVVVDCGDGWTTLYAHFDQINVSPGQKVAAGAPLGVSGLTGFTTGEHLHFEIRLNGAPVNPADYIGF